MREKVIEDKSSKLVEWKAMSANFVVALVIVVIALCSTFTRCNRNENRVKSK